MKHPAGAAASASASLRECRKEFFSFLAHAHRHAIDIQPGSLQPEVSGFLVEGAALVIQPFKHGAAVRIHEQRARGTPGGAHQKRID